MITKSGKCLWQARDPRGKKDNVFDDYRSDWQRFWPFCFFDKRLKNMQKITIRSFGPIKDVVLPITDIIILNGEQASGKSTISKSIYFFKSLPEVIFQAMQEDIHFDEEFNKSLVIACRKQLISIFGTTKHFDDFSLRYEFSPLKYINITKEKHTGHARVVFSQSLKDELLPVSKKMVHLLSMKHEIRSFDDYSLYGMNRKQLLDIKKKIKDIFEENHQPLFIPAGRSLVSTLSGELKNIDSYDFDYLMKDFVQRIFYQRDLFAKDLAEIVEDQKKLTTTPIDFKRVSKAMKLVGEILHGTYKYENGEERIMIDDESYVKIKFASSGQQESLWILLLFFVLILHNEDCFSVVEEPEAHLFPATQYKMVQLLGVYANRFGNQIVITTHSPYIMASVNNLLLAGQTKKEEGHQPVSSIHEYAHFEAERVSAYFVKDGRLVDIIDKETGIVDPTFLDNASEEINRDFDALLGMEDA